MWANSGQSESTPKTPSHSLWWNKWGIWIRLLISDVIPCLKLFFWQPKCYFLRNLKTALETWKCRWAACRTQRVGYWMMISISVFGAPRWRISNWVPWENWRCSIVGQCHFQCARYARRFSTIMISGKQHNLWRKSQGKTKIGLVSMFDVCFIQMQKIRSRWLGECLGF